MPTTITDDALAAIRLPAFARTTGDAEATVALELLLSVLVVTVAWSKPALGGLVVNETVSEVGVASVIDPTAPPAKATELFNSVVSKPYPVMITKLA